MRRKTHEEYIEELNQKNIPYMPIENYITALTEISHMCPHGHIFKMRPNNILNNIQCPICDGRHIGPEPEYQNSIWANGYYKEYYKSYLSEDQMKQHTPFSNKKIPMICPNCGQTNMLTPDDVSQRGFHCICDDSISYPNKFMHNILMQLNLNHKLEYSPKWANNKRYDIYVSKYNLIIENHGSQHYIDVGKSSKFAPLYKQQNNDLFKKILAISNGIEHYVFVDCRKSNVDWIKNSIMSGDLPTLLNFTEDDINWNDAGKYASSSLLLKSVDLFKQGMEIKQIAEIIGVYKCSVYRWLYEADKIGLCDYYNNRQRLKRIRCIELNLEFNSIKEAGKYLNKPGGSIYACLTKKTKTAYGYHWEYVDKEYKE